MQAPPFKQGFGSHGPSEFCIKSKLDYTRGITLKRVTCGRAHLLGLAPAHHSCERTSQHWRAVGDTVSDLTGRKLKFDTSRTMFCLIFCRLCALKLWRVRTFLEIIHVCATTNE